MRSPFINNTIVLLALFLALGIVFGFYANMHHVYLSKTALLIGLFLCVSLLGSTWQIAKKQLHPTPVYGLLICIIFFGIGYTTYTLRLPTHQPTHYTQLPLNERAFLQLKIKEHLKANTFYENYIAEVITLNNTKTKGLLLLHIQKDSAYTSLDVDEVILISGSFKHINASKNPYQFNYNQYMQHQGIYREITTKPNALLFRRKGTSSLVGISMKIRKHLIKKLRQTHLDNDPLSIVQALILGERKDIDKQLYEAYAAAGAIHILAVSGLHIGILYLILMFILKPLLLIKYGASIRSALIVLLLWAFALLAGWSPSVVRAVTMFTFFTIATAFNRPTNSFNTLFLSFFILLLLAPNWLFHVGFQLSYIAVFFILWLQPKLHVLYNPKFYIDRMLWGIITVTIAAQVGILPLSLYYFNQFPGLFFLTNLVILPVLGILLAGGLLLVILATCNSAPVMYVEAYNSSIAFLNHFISWVAAQENFVVSNISFSLKQTIISYFMLLCILVLWKRNTTKNLALTLANIALFIVVCIYERYQVRHNEMVVFHKTRTTIIGIKEAQNLYLMHNSSHATKPTFAVKGYITEMAIDSISNRAIPTLFNFKEKSYLVLDSLGVYSNEFKVDVVILTGSSQVNLSRLIDTLQPAQIIADGSNYNSYVTLWKKTCETKKLPFHHTGAKGAYTIK